MTRILYRALFLLFIAAGLRLSAQTVLPAQSSTRSDVALWTVGSFIADTGFVDEEDGSFIDIYFEEKPGLGISFNHYWTDRFSTEVSLMTFGADLIVAPPASPEVKIAELNARTATAMAQWHFRTGARVSPYLSGGVAHISGTFDINDGVEETLDLQSNVTWTAAVGMDIRLTDRWALAFEAKRVPWNAVEEGGAAEDAIDIDPMLYGSGVRFRF
ncbi:MAG TPA: OmpW family outer membrane protein [Thermoanaerobaculia bacterium]